MASLDDYLLRRSRGLESRIRAWMHVGQFAVAALASMLSPATYNSATREVVARQIYFTAWQIVGGYAMFVAVFSLVITHIVVEAAREFGLYDLALEATVRIVVIEMVPLLTALFVALRTGAAIATEVSLMRIRNEMGALERAGIDPMKLELVPRVIGGTFSVLCLTAVGVVVALFCALIVVSGYRPWIASTADLDQVVSKVFVPGTMILMWAKPLLFGFAVSVIPIAESMNAPPQVFQAPIAVLRAMVRLFLALMLIEVAALVIQYF